MAPLFTVTGRDVLLTHWRMDREMLAAQVPDPLTVESYDESAWVSALAVQTPAVTPGSLGAPAGFLRDAAQLVFRTYVTLDGEAGVYFLSLDASTRTAAAVGRRAFGLPVHRARMRVTRRGETTSFRSWRTAEDSPAAVFQARYRPHGASYGAAPGRLEDALVEHATYFLPAWDNRGTGALRPGDRKRDDPGDEDGTGVFVGTITRDPWEFRPVTASVRRNTLFEAADLPTPSSEPVCHYSPGFEMGVEPVERRVTGRTGPLTAE